MRCCSFSFRENPHESLGILESQNRVFHFQIPRNRFNFALKKARTGCTFKVSRHDSHKKDVAKVEHMKGVMDTKWNPRTREVTVIYDANKTSARNIKHFMA